MAEPYRVLSLFAGIGGFDLGLERTGGFKTVAFCEIDPFCQKVLAKHWPGAHIHDDVRTLTKDSLCNGYAQNALLNQLCKELGGDIALVKNAITNTKNSLGGKTRRATTNGRPNAEGPLSIIMGESAFAAERNNTSSLQSITSLITGAKNGLSTKAPCGKLLSSADTLTIIKFFVITAMQQRRTTVPAHIRKLIEVSDENILTAERLAADGVAVDVICGGFPCQDISLAGNMAGIHAERSGLWGEMCRVFNEVRPRFAFVENVPGLLSGDNGQWFGRVLGDLAEIGYDAEWHCIPASAVGAPHRRDRVWITAYPGQEFGQVSSAHPECESREEQVRSTPLENGDFYRLVRGVSVRVAGDWQRNESAVARSCNGVPDRLDRLAALGNAVVPQIPELIGRAILEAEAA